MLDGPPKGGGTVGPLLNGPVEAGGGLPKLGGIVKLLKEWGWLVAVGLAAYLTYVTVVPYKRAIEAHDASLQQWGQCIKVNPDKSLGWICGDAKAPTPVPAPKK